MRRGVLWTEEDKDFLRQNWKGHSAGVIAKKLGRTRNAVMGAVHRLGLIQTPRKTVLPKKELSRAPGAKLRGGRTIVLIPPKEAPAIAQNQPVVGVPFLEAVQGQCRAVIGSSDDSRGLVTFCGRPISRNSTFSFCDDHLAQYTYPLKRS